MEMKDFKLIVNDQGFIKKVQYILIGLFLVVVGLDTYLALDSIDNNTISNVIQDKTDNGLFILTYLWGTIAANLFFIRFSKPVVNGTIGSIIIIGIAICMALFNIESKVKTFAVEQNYDFSIYMLSMAFGIVIGLIFWRQREKKQILS